MLDFNTLLTGLLIFAARIAGVSIGTIRVIVTVQGRSVIAFFLGIIEVLIWIAVVSTVIHKINPQPVTVFRGDGMRGPVGELYIACRRRELKRLLDIVKAEDPDAFYITEMARDVSKAGRSP